MARRLSSGPRQARIHGRCKTVAMVITDIFCIATAKDTLKQPRKHFLSRTQRTHAIIPTTNTKHTEWYWMDHKLPVWRIPGWKGRGAMALWRYCAIIARHGSSPGVRDTKSDTISRKKRYMIYRIHTIHRSELKNHPKELIWTKLELWWPKLPKNKALWCYGAMALCSGMAL